MRSKMIRQFINEDWEFEIPTSFIDCVFLLLIFFLLTAQFKSMERKLDGNLPKDGPRTTQRDIVEPQEVRVKIFWADRSGRFVAGPDASLPRRLLHIGIRLNNVPCASINDLARKLATVTARSPDLAVVIDARSRVPFKFVLGAVDACARARIDNVKFQAPPVRGGGGGDWWWL
jgi:biopolymer transport protein ExbD